MKNKVYVIQDVPGSREGRPKINIIGASEFGELKVLLPENSQIILSSGPLVFKLKKLLKKKLRTKKRKKTPKLCRRTRKK